MASWILALAAFHLPMTGLVDVDSPLLGQFTLTLPLLVLLAARALDGLTGGEVAVANAFVADVSSPDDREANFGKLAAATNLGAVFGPALAGLLLGTALGYQLPVIAAAGVSLGATVLILKSLPDSSCKPRTGARSAPGAATMVHPQLRPDCSAPPSATLPLGELMRLPGVALLLGASFLVNLAFSFFYIGLPMHAAGELAWSPTETGLFFALLGFVMFLVEGPGLARASRVCSDALLIGAGGLFLAAGFQLLTSHVTAVIFGGAVLIAVGNGLMWPLIVALLSKTAGDNQGAVQGVAGSIGAFASIIGLLLGGILYGYIQGWLFSLSAASILVVVVLAFCTVRSTRAATAPPASSGR
jgi:MFS family permease